MKSIGNMVFGGLLALIACGANASPILYGLTFKVEYTGCAFIGCAPIPLDPRVQIGNSYFGSFVVDDGILASDGINVSGVISAFGIQMENILWSTDPLAAGNVFDGFRGPNGLGAGSPGFDIAGGIIQNIRGGVFGAGDVPFVNFSTDLRIAGNPAACGPGSQYCGNAANAFWTRNPLGAFGGSMQVYAIPEPSTLSALAFGLLMLAMRSAKTAQNRQR